MSWYYPEKILPIEKLNLTWKRNQVLTNLVLCPGFSKYSLFQEEISACVAVHMHYDIDVYNCVWSIILLPHMVGMPFVLFALTKLKVSELKAKLHWEYWSGKLKMYNAKSNTYKDMIYITKHAPYHGFKIIAAWYQVKDTFHFEWVIAVTDNPHKIMF